MFEDLSFNFNYNVSDSMILHGAQKGLIMLHETYDLDIQDFAKGHLHEKTGIEDGSRRPDSLQPDDLASMSSIAFNTYKWYDNSLKYLKEAMDLLSNISKEKNQNIWADFENTLLIIKKHYSTYHNELFQKKGIFIGEDWKLYRNIVDIGLF